jgi:hypothetical protein
MLDGCGFVRSVSIQASRTMAKASYCNYTPNNAHEVQSEHGYTAELVSLKLITDNNITCLTCCLFFTCDFLSPHIDGTALTRQSIEKKEAGAVRRKL